ncbi:MAG: PrkA family serine protein kinase [Halobacteriaceae archaeon]
MARADRFVEAADRERSETYEEPMRFAEYVETVLADPDVAAHASKYLLRAVESAGTRTVVEEGEEVERYRFFDDPYNDGEHAVLGNTAMLNDFVDDLRAVAAGHGNEESIVWFAGPTATGKSELKRCLINGLREYSKTPEGRRYTLEWNLTRGERPRGLSYGEEAGGGDDWHESPVQTHPLSVFPESVREDLLAELNDRVDDEVGIDLDQRLDPFSREAYDSLEERYRDGRESDLFSAVTDPQHLRVTNYVVDVGRGIGVLHAEDAGTPKERLVGSWMPEMFRDFDSRGRKNPQAFSYDGVLSQGNGGLTVVEDAAQHADLVQQLLNVPDERRVKLDKGVGMDLDTQLILISNPDLEAQLNQHEDRLGADPLKALKRRLDKREFTYLTNLSLEVALIRRKLGDERAVWTARDYAELDERVRESATVTVGDASGSAVTREFAPHAVEAAALYDVVSRLDEGDLPGDLDLVEKALLFDRGHVRDGEDRLTTDDLDFDEDATDGEHGIPVTYARDVLADLLTTDLDRRHPDLPVGDVVMPRDVLSAMADGLRDAPVFAASERGEIEDRVVPVKEYVADRQEADVLDAMLAQHRPDEETVEEYVEHVYAWAVDEPVESDRGESAPADPLTMKVFEIEHLGRFDEGDYEGTAPSGAVESFRRNEVVTSLNRRAWERRSEDFRVEDVDPASIPVLDDVLGTDDWDDVRRVFENFDPRQWDDPPSGTETERVKEATVERLREREYSPAAAELTSRRVVEEVAHRWD